MVGIGITKDENRIRVGGVYPPARFGGGQAPTLPYTRSHAGAWERENMSGLIRRTADRLHFIAVNCGESTAQ